MIISLRDRRDGAAAVCIMCVEVHVARTPARRVVVFQHEASRIGLAAAATVRVVAVEYTGILSRNKGARIERDNYDSIRVAPAREAHFSFMSAALSTGSLPRGHRVSCSNES
jgi:hypothetical protein